MKNSQNPNTFTLGALISHLQRGRFAIPDFQREFEWKPWDVRDLMRSIFLDYYIGTMLLWKGTDANYQSLSCQRLYGQASEWNPTHIVLDGQQRLTAMYYAFFAPDVRFPQRANRYYFFIRLDRFLAGEHDTAFDYDWRKHWENLVSDPDQQYGRHIFPLSIIGTGGIFALPNWLQGYQRYWRTRADDARSQDNPDQENIANFHAKSAEEFSAHVAALMDEYAVSFIELTDDIPLDKVCDIFTQINSTGIQLSTFDLINALLRPKRVHLKAMWHRAAPRLDFVTSEKMKTYVLQVMSILRQAYCSPKYLYFLVPGTEKPVRDPDGTHRKEVLVPDPSSFTCRWDGAVDALQHAMNRLRDPRDFGAISAKYLPYVSILPVFAAIQAYMRRIPDEQRLQASRKVGRWYWASVFLNRYSGSVDSTATRDFLDLKAWIDDDAREPGLIAEFSRDYSHIDLHNEIRSGTSIYNGIFNLLVIQGALDWISGEPPQHDALNDHHIIPSSRAAEIGIGREINTILNRTPLSADTNQRVIGQHLPNEYLPKLMERSGEDAVREVLRSHSVSDEALSILLRDPFTSGDYREFIQERQRTLIEAVESLLVKGRSDLAPLLRGLDTRVEQIELWLRADVALTLGNQLERLPPHIREKAVDRFRDAARRNPADRSTSSLSLDQVIQYCDLRDLEHTILSKTLWSLFEGAFSHKEEVARRFAQLAEFRNSIRHSRAVGPVTRKDGEAAILWFEMVRDRTRSSVSDQT